MFGSLPQKKKRWYPIYPEIPGKSKNDTRKYPIIYFNTPTRPEPDPLPGIFSDTRPDPILKNPTCWALHVTNAVFNTTWAAQEGRIDLDDISFVTNLCFIFGLSNKASKRRMKKSSLFSSLSFCRRRKSAGRLKGDDYDDDDVDDHDDDNFDEAEKARAR